MKQETMVADYPIYNDMIGLIAQFQLA